MSAYVCVCMYSAACARAVCTVVSIASVAKQTAATHKRPRVNEISTRMLLPPHLPEPLTQRALDIRDSLGPSTRGTRSIPLQDLDPAPQQLFDFVLPPLILSPL